jgi:asparagine synthase (glutamine-hydrolysing)
MRELLSRLSAFGGDASGVFSNDFQAGLDQLACGELDTAIEVFSPCLPDAPRETIATYLRTYLQEDILVKVDRASMANSLEVRSPFLDTRLIDFLSTVPSSLKLRGFTRKYLLRRLMRDRLPQEVIHRPKMGFGVPLDAWLRVPMRGLMERYLLADALRCGGVFDADAIARLASEHADGKRDHGARLWLILQLQMWRERWGV